MNPLQMSLEMWTANCQPK